MFRHVQAGGCCVSLVTWCGQLFILFGLGITYLAIMTAATAVTFLFPGFFYGPIALPAGSKLAGYSLHVSGHFSLHPTHFSSAPIRLHGC